MAASEATEAVLIAGAGIGGLATAILLGRAGIPVTVVERAARLEPIGAGIQLSPNAGHVVDQLGIAGLLDDFAFRPEALVVHTGRTARPVAEIPYADAEQRHGAPYRTVHRGDLHRVLLDVATVSPSITVVTDAAVTSVQPFTDGVSVETTAGSFAGAILVGADGVRSAVRDAVPGSASPSFAKAIAWRGVAAGLAGGETRPVTKIALAPAAHVVAYALGPGRPVNLVAVVGAPAPDAGRDTQPEDALPAGHPWRDLLGRVPDWTPWPLFTVDPAAPIQAGRIALLGDAAHAVVPFMAQGGALALEDAAVLAASVSRHGMTPEAVAAYAADRQSRVRRVFAESLKTGRIYHLAWPASLARDAAMTALGSTRLARRLDWLYGWRPPQVLEGARALS